jgi:DNA-binding CsgD family transcriptional regulator
VAASSRPPLPVRWTVSAQPVLVGRRRELAALEDAWSHVLRGCRQVVVVGGEPGAGKSRLLAEACTALYDEGARVLVGTCVADLGPPYQPFTEPVEALLAGSAEGAPADERLRVVAGRTAEPHAEGSEHRRQLYDGVVDALTELAREQPLVLALEDLHWAGPPALELLTYLGERTPESRLLLLATHRTTAPDRTAGLVGAVSRLHRLDGARRLDLDGLRTEEVAEFLSREAGVPAHAALGPAAVLRDQTGGNPFFLRELWRDVAGRGGLAALRAGWLAAPASVRDALQSRLLGLSAPQRQTLELAAVVGEEVDVATVVAASAWSRDATLLALDAGVAYGLREHVAPGRYRFPHALARQAVVELLPPSRRAHQHARVATAIEARLPASEARAQALAHHYAQAQALGYGDKAVHYLVEAARSAERALAHEDAARGYAQAAELTDDPVRRDGLRLSAARSHLLGGDFARARGLAEQVASSPDPVERLQAAVLYEAAAWRPGLPGHRAVELLSSALAGGPRDEDDPLRVRALASLGRALAFTGDTDAAGEVGAAAVSRARQLQDDGLLAHALQASLWHGLRPHDVPGKLARATELSALAHRTGDLGHLGPAAYYRGVISYLQGDPDGWAEAQADLVSMSKQTGQDFFAYMAGCLAYGRQFVTGQFAAAERTCAGLLDLGEHFGTDGTEGPSAVQTYMLRRETGAVEQVRPLISGREQPTEHWAPGLLALYTELRLDQPAARLLRWLLADELAHHRDSSQWPAVLVFLVEAALHLEDAAAAEQLQPELLEYAGHNLVAGQFVALFGSADRYLGAVDSLLGRPGADGWLASALELDRRTGATVHQAHTLAATVRHRRRSGADGADLAELERRTRALAEPLGLTVPLRQVGRRPVHVPAQRPDGLTVREAEVLRLLGEGLPNREIADRLVISEHTAANHVRSILAKTGSGNRTQAAMYAASHDLLG